MDGMPGLRAKPSNGEAVNTKVATARNADSKEWTVMDLFCGTGGFAHGFCKADPRFRVVYAIDLDRDAAATAKANHPTALVEVADIRFTRPEDVSRRLGLETVDVVVGGPPCQGFSSLRPNRSSEEDDERNDLYMRFADFCAFFRPRVVVLENVVGLATHREGRTLRRVVKRFAALDYRVDWRILNAAAYGVPQKRERLVMIASRDSPIEFPSTTHYFEGRVIGHHDKRRHMPVSKANPKAVSVMDAISDLPPLERGEHATHYSRKPANAFQAAMRVDTASPTLHKAANHNDKMMEVMRHAGESKTSIPKHLVTGGFSSCYSRLDPNEPSTTITVKFQSPASNKCIHPFQNRTITPREAARIQSFEDSYVFLGSLTKIASQLGNAVPPLLGQAIGSAVARALQADLSEFPVLARTL